MHVQTHIMSGWCIADLLELTPRERLFAMIAASAADVDGLGILVSIDYYVRYHHVLAHNLPFGLVLAIVLAFFSMHRWKAFCLYLGLFHLHLLMDYFGSGPAWGFLYLWPFSNAMTQNAHAWELASWQNVVVTAALIAWTIVIAIKSGKTPFELIAPSVDRKIVDTLRSRRDARRPVR
jgi:inner membrane protein